MSRIQFKGLIRFWIVQCTKKMNLVSCRSAIVIILMQLLFICHLQYKLLTIPNRDLQTARGYTTEIHKPIVKYPNMPHPVDVVLTWVNGSDEKFLKQLHTYRNNMDIRDHVNSDRRYNNKNELKYALRSVEKNMPWIRHVYIVTNGQVPNWLNLDNGYATVIPHEAIFPNKSTLPTFSSPAIEVNLHRIPGLSKHFLYLNDDWLVAKPVEYSTFYTHTEGMIYYWAHAIRPCSHLCPWSMVHNGHCNAQCNVPDCQYDGGDCINQQNVLPAYVLKLMSLTSSPYEMSLQTTHRLFNERFGYNLRYVPPHMPLLVDKDVMDDAWSDFHDQLANTSSHRFRDNWDMQFQFFYTHYVHEKKTSIQLRRALELLDRNQDGRIGHLELLNMRATFGNFSVFEDTVSSCLDSNVSTLFSAGYMLDKIDVRIDEMANCSQLEDILKNTLMLEEKYKHNLLSKVPGKSFYHMILMRSNYDKLTKKLNILRKQPATFICINDDLDHNQESAGINKRIYTELGLFYRGMFPIPSKYELPKGKFNQFSYIYERVASPGEAGNSNTFAKSVPGWAAPGWMEFVLFFAILSCIIYIFHIKLRYRVTWSYWG